VQVFFQQSLNILFANGARVSSRVKIDVIDRASSRSMTRISAMNQHALRFMIENMMRVQDAMQ